MTFCYLFYYTGRQTLGFAVSGIQHDYGLSKYEIGWISATMLWCYAGGQFINGNLGDKLGGKAMMIAGAVLSLAANWVFSFGHTFLFFLLAWGANGYFQSMGFAPGSRLLSNWWDHKHRGFVYGVYIGFSGFSSVLAYVFPVLILGTMHLGWIWIFRLAPLSMLLGALVLLLFVSERPEDKHLHAVEPAGDTPPPAVQDDLTSAQRYAIVLRNWKLYITGLAIGFQNAARYALVVWVPVHFLGMDWKTSSALIDPKWITVALACRDGAWLTIEQLDFRRAVPGKALRRDRPVHGSGFNHRYLHDVRAARQHACDWSAVSLRIFCLRPGVIVLGALSGHLWTARRGHCDGRPQYHVLYIRGHW